jgi:phosphoserine aminotransferase
MKADRIYNFNAGPAALPLPVLEEIQESFLNFAGCGMSITEISHRSKWFDDVINDAVERVKRILKLDDRYHVLFLQGGASMQFCMVPMNLLGAGDSADYVNTGTWSTKAINEARIQGNPSRWWPPPKMATSPTSPTRSPSTPMRSMPTSPQTIPSRAPNGPGFRIPAASPSYRT